jgi:hypothetical protein
MKKLLYKLLGHNKLTAIQDHMQELIARINDQQSTVTEYTHNTHEKLKVIQEQLGAQSEQLSRIERIVKSNRDNIPQLREKLLVVRGTKEYQAVFENKKPLISIRIATYNRAEILTTRTIPSILAQTYKNWELIIVGDNCTDDTEKRIKALKDPRIRFYNFPFRYPYPNEPVYRWHSAGTPGMNKGVELARGEWIAAQDDDDEFTPDHLEVLLEKALDGQFEMVFGKLIQYNTATKKESDIWSYPPEFGKYSSQGAMYLKLLDFIEYDTKSWIVDEPGDWNFCRRMIEAGVRIGATKKMVGKMYFTPKF